MAVGPRHGDTEKHGRLLGYVDEDFVVATVNRRRLDQFVPATAWWTVTDT
jgi:hypothetical protein